MCGRFSITDPRQLVLRFGLRTSLIDLLPRYNVAPTQPVPVILVAGQMEMVRWGLIPGWAKDPRIGSKLINARAESLEEKPAFRDALRARRCLVLADGFYEWRAGEGRREPLHIRLRTGAPFAFAGLWDDWWTAEGERIRSCAIVTTEPNAVVAPIHDRMPAILRPEQELRWIDPAVRDLADLVDLLGPYPSHEMEAVRVSSAVNSVANDGPECLEPVK